jgi:hypothetical protein
MKYKPWDFDYSIVGVDISQKKLEETIVEIDKTVETKGDVKQLFEAYLNQERMSTKTGKICRKQSMDKKSLKINGALSDDYEKKYVSAAYMGNVYDEEIKNDESYIYGNCMMGQLYFHNGNYGKAIRNI